MWTSRCRGGGDRRKENAIREANVEYKTCKNDTCVFSLRVRFQDKEGIQLH